MAFHVSQLVSQREQREGYIFEVSIEKEQLDKWIEELHDGILPTMTLKYFSNSKEDYKKGSLDVVVRDIEEYSPLADNSTNRSFINQPYSHSVTLCDDKGGSAIIAVLVKSRRPNLRKATKSFMLSLKEGLRD